MKPEQLDFSAAITDLDGNPMPGADGPFTFRDAATIALMAPQEADASETVNDMLDRTELALRLRKADKIALSPEEITLLRSRVHRHFGKLSALVVFRFFHFTGGRDRSK